MKKIFLLSAFALTIFGANAQFTFGVKGGLNLANTAVSPTDGVTYKSIAAIQLGVTAEYAINNNIGVESGLLYSGKGAKGEVSILGESFSVTGTANYLEIPVNAVYKINAGNSKVLLNAGPYFAFALGGKLKPSVGDSRSIKIGSSEDSDIKGTDVGLNIGAGLLLKEKITVGLQYGLGLANISPRSGETINNRVFSLTVGYKFVK
ncbi:MAG: porin family protein [Bacteroidota bacterium]|jgi:hypothetical protein